MLNSPNDPGSAGGGMPLDERLRTDGELFGPGLLSYCEGGRLSRFQWTAERSP